MPGRSWAAWLADALGARLHNLAEDGAVAGDVVELQLPAARPPYAFACVYVGVNDVRGTGWDAAAYERRLETILPAASSLASRSLVATIPLALGRPPAGPKVGHANALIRRAAAPHGAVLVELEDLAGWPLVYPDRVHPTPLGQLEIAERAAAALAAAGVVAPLHPRELAPPDTSAPARLRMAAVAAREQSRDLLRLLRERPAARRKGAAPARAPARPSRRRRER